jgi:hypothetical protein
VGAAVAPPLLLSASEASYKVYSSIFSFMKTIEDVVKAWNLTPLPPKQFNMVRAHRVYDSTYPILTVAGINEYDQTLACRFSHAADGYIMYRLEWNEERQEYDAYSL